MSYYIARIVLVSRTCSRPPQTENYIICTCIHCVIPPCMHILVHANLLIYSNSESHTCAHTPRHSFSIGSPHIPHHHMCTLHTCMHACASTERRTCTHTQEPTHISQTAAQHVNYGSCLRFGRGFGLGCLGGMSPFRGSGGWLCARGGLRLAGCDTTSRGGGRPSALRGGLEILCGLFVGQRLQLSDQGFQISIRLRWKQSGQGGLQQNRHKLLEGCSCYSGFGFA